MSGPILLPGAIGLTGSGQPTTLGVMGGGQLGRMFIQEALNYDVYVQCLDPDADAPCKHLATSFRHGSLLDFDTVVSFGSDKDVVTVEIEHVNVEALKELEDRGVKVFPQSRVLAIVQDKGLQKEFYLENNLPFGGVNHSGTGSYHGYFGFKAFSHERAVYLHPAA